MLIKLRTWSCHEIRMQDEVTILRLIIDTLKWWKSSYIREQPEQIKILFQKKLRTD